MNIQTLIAIISIIVTILTTFVVLLLQKISNSQEELRIETKEMNKDIRDLLVNMKRNDEQILAISKRLDETLEHIKYIDDRVYRLEQH